MEENLLFWCSLRAKLIGHGSGVFTPIMKYLLTLHLRQSFPAHLHNLLTIALAESHVVHTKIYPRYKSRQNISFARDGFSSW
jgi:hypothetical protein